VVNVSIDDIAGSLPLGERAAPTKVLLPLSGAPFRVETYLRQELEWREVLPASLLFPPNKPALTFGDRPMWHEFIVLELLKQVGWDGVWTKNFGGAAFWTAPGIEVDLPKDAKDVFQALKTTVGNGGFWDVFAWTDETFLFVESKQRGKDKLQQNQLRFLETGLRSDHPIRFAIAEYIRR